MSRRMYEGLGMRLADAGALIELAEPGEKSRAAVENAAGQGPTQGRGGRRDRSPPLPSCGRSWRIAVSGWRTPILRVNAAQVHNAIRKSINLVSSPNDPRYRVSYLDSNQPAAGGGPAGPGQFRVGGWPRRTSVKQMFMIVAQMLKYTGRNGADPLPDRGERRARSRCWSRSISPSSTASDEPSRPVAAVRDRAGAGGGQPGHRPAAEEPAFPRPMWKSAAGCASRPAIPDAGRFIGQTPANASIENGCA